MKKVFLFLVLMGFMSNVYSTAAIIPAGKSMFEFLQAVSKTPEGLALVKSYIQFFGEAGVIKSTGNIQKGLTLLANSDAFRKEFFKNPRFLIDENGKVTSSFTGLSKEIDFLTRAQEEALQAKALKEDPNCLELLVRDKTPLSATMTNLRELKELRIKKEINSARKITKNYELATVNLNNVTKLSKEKFELLNKKTLTKSESDRMGIINEEIKALQKKLNKLPAVVLTQIRLNNTRDFLMAAAAEEGLNEYLAWDRAIQNGALAIKEGPLPKDVENHLVEVAAQLKKNNMEIDLSNPEDKFKLFLIGYSPNVNEWLLEESGGIGQLSGKMLSKEADKGGAPLGMKQYFKKLVEQTCSNASGKIADFCKQELFPLVRKSGICATARIGI